MAGYKLTTKHGYDFYEMASMLQKAIRRGDYQRAGFAANELIHQYRKYLWKRLLIISAEDCYGIITKEIVGLKLAADEIGGKDDGIFVAKAICLLCEAKKNRDACYVACNYITDNNLLSPEEIKEECPIDECELSDNAIPDWVFDVHTLRGKIRGKTIEDMIKEEQEALNPKQPSLFDYANWDIFLKSGGH